MRTYAKLVVAVLMLVTTVTAHAERFGANRLDRRVAISTDVLADRMASRDPIPSWVLRNAQCIAAVRVVKAGFIFGGEGSTGLVSCRTPQGWSAPSFLNLGGASVGLQIGVQFMDTVLVFVSDYSRQILSHATFQLGTDLSVAAGPLGEGSGIGATPQAHVLSYSHVGGLFAGISIDGTVIAHGPQRNGMVYGNVSPVQILSTPGYQAPQIMQPFVNALNQYVR